MERLKMHTPDLADENFAKLAALFPNAVTETKDENGNVVRAIDADVLRQEISATVVEGSQERYQFTWPDKKKSVVLANQPIAKTLRLDREKSVGRDGTPGSIDTENIYIEGDNLDALKLLQETYLGKVKMIYIDPPYNTGNDFIYEDDFSLDTDEYLGNSGQFDEEGNRLVQNTESNGRFHTDWLNMIYPRLKVAKDLLSDDGVIFISIDDGEAANLIKLCNDVMGETNLVADLIWQKKFSRSNDATYFSTMHDHILCYCKQNIMMGDIGWKIGLLPRGEEIPNGYSNPDNDPRGVWTSVILSAKSGSESLLYEIETPSGRKVYPPSGRFWSCSKETFEKWKADNRIWFGTNGDGTPRKKTFLSEVQSGLRPNTILFQDDVGNNQEAKQETKALFNGLGVFDSPKPVRLLTTLLRIANTEPDAIILDFFSGSATTAHAVMQLNMEEIGNGGYANRKFIMVQLPEQTDAKSEAYKAGYKTICEIGEERIRRAGKKIKEESPLTTADLDIGFRVFKVDSSNMEDVYYRPADYNQGQMELFADNIKPDRTPEDLLFQVMLDLGILLSSDIQETEIAGKKVFSVADGYLIACFDKDVTEETVKAIAQKQPVYAVFRDSSMASDSVATNFEQIFETYSPRTQRKVL
ncbi:site-specific DNA-methyltransferase [Ruminococcus callidus]|uniref:site-specific DNA-methyltransferase n=1 Tax=Ruminococcus callidus TaxID=40519 RepID=UPI0035216C4C